MGKHEEYAMTFKEFWERTRWTYEKKLQHAKMVIEEAVTVHGNKLALACSFGKDSLTILHMALAIDPNILVTFQNTYCQARSIYQLRDKLVKEWNINFIETKPATNYWKIKKEYGYPGYKKRRKGSQKPVPRCCYLLKKGPAKEMYKEKKIEAIIIGIQGQESYNRKYLIAWKGCMSYTTSDKKWKYYPLAYWNNKDVWKYVNDNNIPYPKEYDNKEVTRMGCLPCTAYKGWEKFLKKVQPRLLQRIINDMNKNNLSKYFK